jgi:hypothetical protein
MIIHDFDIMWAILFPTKTYTPLPINPDTVLTCPVPGQRLKSITAQSHQILQCFRIVQDNKPTSRPIGKPLELPDTLARKEPLGHTILKPPNHGCLL